MQNSKKETLSLLLAFLGYAIFGFSFMFSKEALAITTPLVLLAVRFTVAFLILNLLVLTGKFKINFRGKPIKWLLLLGILQPVAYFLCETFGVNLLSTFFVGVIVSLVPVVSLVFGSLILHEHVSGFQVFCVLGSVAGVFLTTLNQESGSFNWTGFLLIFGAVCAAGLFNVFSRRMSSMFTAFERTYLMFAVGCVTFIGIALLQSRGNMQEIILKPLYNGNFWISILYLAAASSVGAFLMINYSVSHLNIARATIFANITTIISILAGVLILKESFSINQVIGSLIIIASVYGVNRPVRQTVIA